MHEELYELKEMLMKELEEYGRKGELTGGSLDIVDKLSHAIKNLCKIIESSEEYSNAPYEGGMGNSGRGSYRWSPSYARARGRDSMGRYSNRRYSREGGYSRADDMEGMIESIRGMMQELPQNVQQDAQRFVQKLEQEMM